MKAHCSHLGLLLVTRRHRSLVVVWCSGSALVWINEVNLRQARLVLGWVTMSGLFPVLDIYLGV